MVSVDVEVVIVEVSLNVVSFILKTIHFAIGELSFEAKVIFKALQFGVGADVLDVDISVDARDIHLI